MRTLHVIGIGAGNPDYLTVQAINAMNEVDVFFVLDKGEATHDLVDLRRHICDRFVGAGRYRMVTAKDPERDRESSAYTDAVRDWHRRRVEVYEALLATELAEDGVGGILVWGDPSLYDSTLRIVEELAARGAVQFRYDVIPGITSVQALVGRHRITLHRIGEPVQITTGRKLRAGLDDSIDSVVVMLDADCSFKDLDPDAFEIFWGAYLGTEDEILIAGDLGEVSAQIQQVRAEARARKGWVFDTYLLRRRR